VARRDKAAEQPYKSSPSIASKPISNHGPATSPWFTFSPFSFLHKKKEGGCSAFERCFYVDEVVLGQKHEGVVFLSFILLGVLLFVWSYIAFLFPIY
jgi:hypothetical protein